MTSIPLTKHALQHCKSVMRAALPQLSTQHAYEAISAGLQFSTYAALRACPDFESGATRALDEHLLNQRLQSLNYPALPAMVLARFGTATTADNPAALPPLDVSSVRQAILAAAESTFHDWGNAAQSLLDRSSSTGTGAINLAKIGYLPSQIGPIDRFMHCRPGVMLIAGGAGDGKKTTVRTIATMAKQSDIPIAYAGEMREAEHAHRVFETAYSLGEHLKRGLIVATVHCHDAVSVLDMLTVYFGVEINDLYRAGHLNLMILYQKLVPTVCIRCATAVKGGSASHWHKSVTDFVAQHSLDVSDSSLFARNPEGCLACAGGYTGRTAVAEVLTADDGVMLSYLSGGVAATRSYLARTSDHRLDSDNMYGKTAAHHALYLSLRGRIAVDTLSKESAWFDQ